MITSGCPAIAEFNTIITFLNEVIMCLCAKVAVNNFETAQAVLRRCMKFSMKSLHMEAAEGSALHLGAYCHPGACPHVACLCVRCRWAPFCTLLLGMAEG